jgi:L-amino acid N-acyltransferase YncA
LKNYRGGRFTPPFFVVFSKVLYYSTVDEFIIRPAIPDDLQAITDIYNQAVLNTTATFDTEVKTLEEQRSWYEQHGPRNPILVVEQAGVVVGWAALSPWSDRRAYSNTAEASVYITENNRNQGIGHKLSKAIINSGRDAGLHTLIARIVAGNDASLHLAEMHSFKQIGVMKEVGFKFGRFLDVFMMQLIYD